MVDYLFDFIALFVFLLLVPVPLLHLDFRKASKLGEFFLDGFIPLVVLLELCFHDFSLVVPLAEAFSLGILHLVAAALSRAALLRLLPSRRQPMHVDTWEIDVWPLHHTLCHHLRLAVVSLHLA